MGLCGGLGGGGGWRLEDGGWRMEDGGWRVEDGGWRVEDGGGFGGSVEGGWGPKHQIVKKGFPNGSFFCQVINWSLCHTHSPVIHLEPLVSLSNT